MINKWADELLSPGHSEYKPLSRLNPYNVSKQLLDVLNDLQLDYAIESDGKVFLRTREFFPRQVEFPEIVRDLVDRMYCRGHKDGFERGAYETETREDV